MLNKYCDMNMILLDSNSEIIIESVRWDILCRIFNPSGSIHDTEVDVLSHYRRTSSC